MRYSKLLILLFIPILFILPANASYGKYAILIFGGYGGAQESFDERIYVSAEMAYLFETLIEQCEYENDNIYVFNLGGEKNTSSHYDLFTDSTGISEVVHYFNANFNTFIAQ